MNKNIDLTKILKDCPKDTKFYSSIFGDVKIAIIKSNKDYPITIFDANRSIGPLCRLSKNGKYNNQFDGECILLPSKDQRDWSKFTAPWLKKERFDPKTLKTFDKVLVRDECYQMWKCNFYAHINDDNGGFPYVVINEAYKQCIPYNDETKHLLGTNEDAPDYYQYWED